MRAAWVADGTRARGVLLGQQILFLRIQRQIVVFAWEIKQSIMFFASFALEHGG
jgi:hypothetical protein